MSSSRVLPGLPPQQRRRNDDDDEAEQQAKEKLPRWYTRERGDNIYDVTPDDYTGPAYYDKPQGSTLPPGGPPPSLGDKPLPPKGPGVGKRRRYFGEDPYLEWGFQKGINRRDI